MSNEHLFQDDSQGDGIIYSLMDDFFSDFEDSLQNCESLLIDLEHNPANKDMLNSLFRSVHTIKGNLFAVGLNEFSPIVQSTEDLLDAIRHQQLNYDSMMCDIILLSLDITKRMIKAKLDGGQMIMTDKKIIDLCQNISSIAEVEESHRQKFIKAAITTLDPSTHIFDKPKLAEQALKQASLKPLNILTVFHHHEIEVNEDLTFFEDLAKPLERRSLYWQGRTARLLDLCLSMNERAGKPVEPQQLAVAVLLHDVGMAFLPLDILHKAESFNSTEKHLLQQHPQTAFQLLSSSDRWQVAAQIILQHHERENGTGYPQGLEGDDICPGAKILAIADTYDACAHERAHHIKLKRPFIRSVMEINNHQGRLFDNYWVEVFNQVARNTEHREWK